MDYWDCTWRVLTDCSARPPCSVDSEAPGRTPPPPPPRVPGRSARCPNYHKLQQSQWTFVRGERSAGKWEEMKNVYRATNANTRRDDTSSRDRFLNFSRSNKDAPSPFLSFLFFLRLFLFTSNKPARDASNIAAERARLLPALFPLFISGQQYRR